MRKIFILFTIVIFPLVNFANGVLITDSQNGTYFRLLNSVVTVDVNNQVALVKSNQLFVNNTGNTQLPKYAFPMPQSGAAIQLRWCINDVWHTASFAAQAQDTTMPGPNPGTMNQNLRNYLGDTPLYFNLPDSINNNDTIEVEITYVQLLSYKFDIVSFEYNSNYSLIQSNVIYGSQRIDFNLFSARTIISLELENYNAEIENLGHNATLFYSAEESLSVENFIIKYQLSSEELGIIDFSTFLPDSINNCDTLGNGFLGLIIEPESNENTEIIEKNFTLIIDKSGSMSGNKIIQAKEAATFIVNNLNLGDYFNIICFDTDVASLSEEHLPFNSENLNLALNFINNISAEGGTNINDVLTTAINQFNVVDVSKANIIIFFTDGEATAGITNTTSILQNVQDAVNFNETQIFLYTFGIGSNSNEQLLTLLANQNNGFSQFINDDEVESVISDFYLTIRNPVLLNTQIEFIPNIITSVYPNPYPNLYKGMQLIITGRYPEAQDITIVLSGNAFNTPVSYSYDITLADTLNEGLAFLPKLWAKGKIDYLSNLFYTLPDQSEESDSLQSLIEDISLCYQVISNFTSFSGENPTELFENTAEFKYSFSPNPFIDNTSIKINSISSQDLAIYFYDINGRIVRIIKTRLNPGENIITWDGYDDNNTDLKSGIYLYKFSLDKKEYYGKIEKQ
jgi:Ca-activated chloride channel family protein